MLRLDHVTFSYGAEEPVVRDFSLEIPQGSRVCLTGPSGQGKTTVLRLLLGLEAPRQGTVFVPAGTRFSAVFQEDRLLPWKTTLENAALFSDEATARRILTELGLGGCLTQPVSELSGGQRRRVAIARAVCAGPELLLLDEPFKGLDGETRRDAASYIRRHAPEATVLCVTHDREDAAALGAESVVEM